MPAIVILATLVAWHESTTGLPGDGETGGVAVKEVIIGPAITVTFTIALAVLVPAALVAVST